MMTTVLIVEDDSHIRKFMAINLAARGYRVIEADGAKPGLRQLQEQKPDVVLLDIRMPGLSGLDMLKIMTEDLKIDIPVIIVTASHLNLVDSQFTGSQQVADVLIKPMEPRRLVQAIDSAVHGWHH
jgi:two-component system, OmpR family, alkaline phosphatase synthesis response regulator PhoP